jgi:membrane-associated phospholipid phosphatase
LAPRLLTDPDRPWECRWCDRDDQGRDTLNGLDAAVRRHWRWDDQKKAHDWSNRTLLLSLAAPTTAFAIARGGVDDGFGSEMLIVLEAAAVDMALTQATKYLFRRHRPWAQASDPPAGQEMGSRESTLSFVSGHSSLSFAMAVSTGSLASLRGDEGKEWVWAVGLTSAAATAYLRIAADKHYFTDVLAGAALGATVGWVIPRLFDRRPEQTVEPTVLRPTPPAPLFNVVIGGRGPAAGPGGVLLSGGVHRGGPFVSATWSF